jgi:hypothetical protein
MDEIINSLESAVSNKNWYGALFIALSIPDICGKIDAVHTGSQARYATWYEQYVQSNYTYVNTHRNETTVFLSGNDCYALRCAFLHEGQDDITNQRAREAIDNYHFIAPIKNKMIHCNKSNDKLQLQVDIFCTDIINGARQWLSEINEDDQRHERIQNLLKIYLPDSDGNIKF